MTGKIGSLFSTLIEDKLDFLFITETWLKSPDDHVISDFLAAGSDFTIHQQPRAKRRGGGVAILSRSNL